MSTWFSAAAVAPSLARDWHLAPAELGLLTVAVQVGFVVGALTASLSGVVDVLPTRWVLVGSALAAAGLNAGLIASGGDLRFSVVLRFGLGFSLAGVYPTGMKLLSGWFQAGRGMAIGTLVGALTLGSALPHFLAGIGLLGELPWQAVIAATSGGAVLSALVAAAWVRPGPFASPSARIDVGWALRSLADPAVRLANLGYFGHMWEPYAMRTWVPAFLFASFSVALGPNEASVARSASLAAAAAIGVGALGSVMAGLAADRGGQRSTPAVGPGGRRLVGAFMVLAFGPATGVIAMLRLRLLPEAFKLAAGRR
jgi:MFS family permease